ncbi:hypothetical protein [Flexibacterium corallicola]|uniref:hypothetical protein n=1 Tax=Flexibacterium corallicola TaxID=3037259 RepID=UPI00286F5A5B|nr:hypothetical protein [Pseudovibrio sp. M1P-2-3]
MYFRLLAMGLLVITAPVQASTKVVGTETIRITKPQPDGIPQIEGAFPVDTSGEQTKRPAAEDAGVNLTPISALEEIPRAVQETRNRLLDIARSGKIENLRPLLTEHSTLLNYEEISDPIAYLRENSGDGQGFETLAILQDILEAEGTLLHAGQENEAYVWPYFSQVSLNELSAKEMVSLLRVITSSEYYEMLDYGAWTFFRLGIAPDGTLLYFVAGD